MTATLRPRVQANLVRHDTAGEWILPSTPTGTGASSGSISASLRCVSPVRENWTILSESQVEISYKAALSATPVTAPCTPGDEDDVTEATGSSYKKAADSINKRSPKVVEKEVPASLSKVVSGGGIQTNVSSDEDFGYNQRKSRVAGNGANKSRNNRRK